MGHGSILRTEQYAHATDEGKRRVVEAAGRRRGVVVKMASKKQSGNEMPKLGVRKLLNFRELLVAPGGFEPPTKGL